MWSFCLSFYKQDNWRTWKRTSTKLGTHGQGMTLLTFGGDPDPRVDFGSLLHFLDHCGIGDFWTFISISLTINGRFVPCLAKCLNPTRKCIHNISGQIRRTFGSGSGLIENPDSNSGLLLFQMLALGEVCALWLLSFLIFKLILQLQLLTVIFQLFCNVRVTVNCRRLDETLEVLDEKWNAETQPRWRSSDNGESERLSSKCAPSLLDDPPSPVDNAHNNDPR